MQERHIIIQLVADATANIIQTMSETWLTFDDGEKFNTSGPLRKEKRKDGWYVMGQGRLIPVETETQADNYINKNKWKKN